MSSIFSNLFIFLLATFLGLEVIRRVSPLLHTPLMSLTNAISAISLVGSLTILGRAENTLSITLGAIAVIASMTNVVSGFLITDRMLRMFKTRKPGAANGLFLPVFMLGAIATGTVELGPNWTTNLSYLIASGLFVMSLRWMNHPKSARWGCWAGEIGMVVAIAGTILALANDPVLAGRSPAYGYIVGALAVGAIIGYPISLVPMTAVPQRTALSPCLRWFGGRTGWHLRVFLILEAWWSRHIHRLDHRLGSASWVCDVHRLPDRLRETRRDAAGQADYV